MRVLGAVLAVAGVPVAALLVLALIGRAMVGPALLASVVTLLAALVLALFWSRDLNVLAETLRQVGADEPAGWPMREPVLPGMQRLGRAAERLARRVAARTALVEQFRRTDGAVVERLPDPLIVLAADRSVRRANSAARAAFGADMPAVLRHPDLRAAIDRAFASGATETAEVTLPVPVPREVHAAVVPMDPPMADGGQAVVVLSDRSRERAVERTRADFVANVSHELRTPLTSLIGFIETLLGPAADDPPAQQRFLGIMGEQAARMNRLIDDLLSLSRIELIEHQVPSATVDLAELLARLAAGFEPRLRAAHGVARHANAGGCPGCGRGRGPVGAGGSEFAGQCGEIRPGGRHRSASSRRIVSPGISPDPARGWPARPGVVVSVADQGAGIPRAHLPRLTERFYRVDTSRSRAAGGTGLGLAIVKHVVNRHRGQMLIESEEGVGTTVSVWLPQATAPAGPI